MKSLAYIDTETIRVIREIEDVVRVFLGRTTLLAKEGYYTTKIRETWTSIYNATDESYYLNFSAGLTRPYSNKRTIKFFVNKKQRLSL